MSTGWRQGKDGARETRQGLVQTSPKDSADALMHFKQVCSLKAHWDADCCARGQAEGRVGRYCSRPREGWRWLDCGGGKGNGEQWIGFEIIRKENH